MGQAGDDGRQDVVALPLEHLSSVFELSSGGDGLGHGCLVLHHGHLVVQRPDDGVGLEGTADTRLELHVGLLQPVDDLVVELLVDQETTRRRASENKPIRNGEEDDDTSDQRFQRRQRPWPG